LSENFLPKIKKFGFKKSRFGKFRGEIKIFGTPVISSVGDLELLSVGKLQLPARPTFLNPEQDTLHF